MKAINITKSKFEQVAEILDKEGYISDSQAFKIWGDETGVYKVLEHERIWKKLQQDRHFFADKEIIEKTTGHRCHLVRVQGQEKGEYYKVGKEFYKEVEIQA